MKEKDGVSIKEIITYIVIIVIVILIKTYVVTPILVSGNSMDETLLNKDVLLLNKMAYYFNDIKRFDIVIVDNETDYIIKRVIGLPGEKIEFKDNKLYVDGKFVKENFYHDETDDFEEVVPKGKYFVLGDNRDVSIDSRMLGSFPKNKILGRARLIIFPFNRFGKVK